MPYTGSSIVDYLKSVGQPSDFGYRKKIYEGKGMSGKYGSYTGSAAQNVALLGELRKTEVKPTVPTGDYGVWRNPLTGEKVSGLKPGPGWVSDIFTPPAAPSPPLSTGGTPPKTGGVKIGGILYPSREWYERNIIAKGKKAVGGREVPISAPAPPAALPGLTPEAQALVSDYGAFKKAFTAKYGSFGSYKGMSGEEGFRAYWESRKSQIDWMNRLAAYGKPEVTTTPPTIGEPEEGKVGEWIDHATGQRYAGHQMHPEDKWAGEVKVEPEELEKQKEKFYKEMGLTVEVTEEKTEEKKEEVIQNIQDILDTDQEGSTSVISGETVTKPTAPTAEEEYEELRTKYEVEPLETELADVDKQIADIYGLYEKAKIGERKRLAPMAIIRLREAAVSEEQRAELNSLYLRKNAIQTQLNSKYKTIDTIMGLKQTSYENARGEYEFKVNKALQIQQLIEGRQDDYRANLIAITNLLKDVDWADIPEDMRISVNNMERLAGWPVGTIEAFTSQEPGVEVKWTHETTDAMGNEVLQFYGLDDAGSPVLIKGIATGAVKTKKDDEELDKLLSITEAEKLGVPYGTTKREAIGMLPTKVADMIEDKKDKLYMIDRALTLLGVDTETGEETLERLAVSGPTRAWGRLTGKWVGIGLGSTEQIEFENLISQVRSGALFEIGGKQLTEPERAELTPFLPDIYTQESVNITNLKELKRKAEPIYNRYLEQAGDYPMGTILQDEEGNQYKRVEGGWLQQ